MNDAEDRHNNNVARGSSPDFIPSVTWQGSKPGYYFGTADHHRGTGYYRDAQQQQQQQQQDDDRMAPPPARKRAKRSVQIAEDLNETVTIPSRQQLLLEQAEQNSATTKVLDLTPRGVLSAAASLSKAYEKNELQRAEYTEQPDQYMDSEIALYENIRALKALAADPTLFAHVLETDAVATLTNLLLHDNEDVVSSVVAVLLEWLDPSLLENDKDGRVEPAVVAVASAVVTDMMELLVGNLGKLPLDNNTNDDDDDDDVGKGTEDILSVIENLMDMDLTLQADDTMRLVPDGSSVANKLCRDTLLVSWLFQQIEAGQELKGRALELLAMLVSREDVHGVITDWSKIPLHKPTLIEDDGVKNNGNAKPTYLDGMEILLQTVAIYRKKQPEDEAAVEVLENACNVVDSILTFSALSVQAFLDAQGIELVVRCLKEGTHAGGVVLKWLDFGGSGPVSKKAWERAVEAGTLKYLGSFFMGRSLPTPAPVASTGKKYKKQWGNSIETTTIRILYGLTRHLTDESPNDAKQRLLAKFVGDEKCDRLVELTLAYDEKARLAEFRFFKSDVEETMESEDAVKLAAFAARLSGGGDILHRIAAITAFCCVGSKRCHERVLSQLHLQKSGISLIRAAIEEFLNNLDDGEHKQQLQQYLEQL